MNAKLLNITPEREGEIALNLLRYQVLTGDREPKLTSPQKLDSDLGRIAKDTGIPKEELRAVLYPIMREKLNRMFGVTEPNAE